LAMRVRHMLISHHGTGEWGSPRPPMTLEAAALHFLEFADAQLRKFATLLKERREPESPWTAYERTLGRRLFAGYGALAPMEALSIGEGAPASEPSPLPELPTELPVEPSELAMPSGELEPLVAEVPEVPKESPEEPPPLLREPEEPLRRRRRRIEPPEEEEGRLPL